MKSLHLRSLILTAALAALGALPALAQQAAPATPAVPAGISAMLPRDLSPWNMFLSADIIVKAVIIGLVIASVVTWTVALAKEIELFALRQRLRRDVAVLDNAGSLGEARLSVGTPADGVKERVASRLERIEAAIGRGMTRATGILATIGATAPFVGLFGTVWGIMNSFIGISKAQTTNLAVVAPGIAEALLATAVGLVAAIPAVVIYNVFARQTTGCRGLVADAAAAVMRLVSRDLEQGVETLRLAAE